MTYTIHRVRSSIADWAVYDEDDNVVYRGDEQDECQDWIDLAELEAAE
jgi:hypothetical protein